MPPARSARARQVPASRARARPRAVPGGARGIRWDRVSRVALLVVLLGILALYIGPARSYLATMGEAKHRRAEVSQLKRENARLRARRAALRSSASLEREARRLGMVRAGERSYSVKHLPKGP
jgi:cell division protein FtsB